MKTIDVEEVRQFLWLQIAWLRMDRDHLSWGCSAQSDVSPEGKRMAILEMRNENFVFNVYHRCVQVEARSVTAKSDSIAVQFLGGSL
jgi:hypothetical protein